MNDTTKPTKEEALWEKLEAEFATQFVDEDEIEAEAWRKHCEGFDRNYRL